MNSGVAPILFCSKCGTPTPASAQFCMKCGAPLAAAPSAVASTPAPGMAYGGFWMRFLAIIIDGIIVGICCAPFIVFVLPGIIKAAQNPGSEPDPQAMMAMMGGIALFQLAALAINWLYEALMTSSSRQATVGKMALGLKVIDMNGRRISFARATGRHFAKILSGMIMMIGYIMAAFTDRHQALHDMLAGTLVVKK